MTAFSLCHQTGQEQQEAATENAFNCAVTNMALCKLQFFFAALINMLGVSTTIIYFKHRHIFRIVFISACSLSLTEAGSTQPCAERFSQRSELYLHLMYLPNSAELRSEEHCHPGSVLIFTKCTSADSVHLYDSFLLKTGASNPSLTG